MAERRMFAKTIIDSDAFLDMPQSTQLLYFHLSMRADDDGFINNPKSITRNVKCNEDDLRILIAKKFIIPFESGVVVIKHWRIHNYIRNDRYKETKYKEEKASLSYDENNAYTQNLLPVYQTDTIGIPLVSKMDTQDRIGKDRIGKDRIEEKTILTDGKKEPPSGGQCLENAKSEKPKRFVKPTVEEVAAYCAERKNGVDAERFVDFYESKGWKVGNSPMKDWRAAVRNWESRDKASAAPSLYTEADDQLLKGIL